ncbi:MAG: pilus assembly protein [Gemmataceae bacterium]|nr:pilus assembly protein [Gemmataceae bacterium]
MRRPQSSRHARPARRGVAAVELAFVFLLFVIPLMLGIWEVGRMVQVQQLVSNATREGARLSAQAYTINSTGTPTQIYTTSGAVNIRDTVYDYLYAAGLTGLQPSDVTVTFQFLTPRATDYVPLSTDPVGTSWPAGSTPTDPCFGEKGQIFTITVSVPWDKVRWINMGLINPTSVTFNVTWQMLTDDRFTVNATLPVW